MVKWGAPTNEGWELKQNGRRRSDEKELEMKRGAADMGQNTFAIRGWFRIVMATACAGVLAACGGDDNGGTNNAGDGGPDSTADVSSDVRMVDSGPDQGTPESGPEAAPSPDAHPPDAMGPDVMAQCPTPTFAPVAGTIVAGTSVSISAANLPTNDFIFFTTDMTLPTHASPVYSGPVQVNMPTTFHAIAGGPTCLDSNVATAAYAIMTMPDAGPDSGGAPPAVPAFNPSATTQPNVFSVALTSSVGSTICYTLDGGTPTCSNGVCGAGTLTYNGTGVAINETEPGAPTVNLTAIACANGRSSTAPVSQKYTLQVATPTFQAPAAGSVPFPGGTPTLSTTTPGATIRYTTDGSTPSCLIGTLINASNGTVPVAQNVSFLAIACRTGFAPSQVTPATAYSVVLGAPTFSPTNAAPLPTAQGASGIALTITNPNTTGTVCWSGDPTKPPACGATAGTCAPGTAGGATTITATGQTFQALVCGSGLTPSAVVSSGAYALGLDPIAFSPASGAGSIPQGGSLPVTIYDSVCSGTGAKSPGTCTDTNPDQAYSFICYTIDGTTPDCGCTSTTTSTMTKVSANTKTVTLTTPTTIKAIACDTSASAYASAAAQATYGAATQMQAPAFVPAATGQVNDLAVTFTNQDPTENALFCWSTTVPGATPACATGGSVTCTTTATAPTMTSGASDHPAPITATGTTLYAWACDGGAVGKPASLVVSNTYTLTVGAVTISLPNGPATIGQAITFASATRNSGANIIYHYTTDGSGATCASPNNITGVNGSAAGSGSTASYTLTGNEVAIKVIGCKVGYNDSAPASATYGFVVQPPMLAYGTGTYDDVLKESLSVSPNVADAVSWLCYDLTNGAVKCGAAFDTCQSGTLLSHTDATNGGWGDCTMPPFPPSNAPNALAGRCHTIQVNSSGSRLNAVSCAIPGAQVFQSAQTSASYTLTVDPIVFVPAGGAQAHAIAQPMVGLTPGATAPNGKAGTLRTTQTATICYTAANAAAPTVPTTCPATPYPPATVPTGFATCSAATDLLGSPFAIAGGGDIGVATTYYAWACKAGMTATALTSVSYTFSAYSQTVAETGLVADFTDPTSQKLATKDAAFAYLSWDATNLYVGFDTTGNTVNGATFVHFYVGLPSATGTQTADNVAVNDGRGLPVDVHAVYHVYGSDGTAGGVDVLGAGGTWTAKTGTGVGYRHVNGSTFYELSIPLATFGVTPVTAATQLNVLGGVYNVGSGASYGSWPSAGVLGNADTGGWTRYQTLMLGDDFAPNDSNNTLPH
jgi:hypothetical protein